MPRPARGSPVAGYASAQLAVLAAAVMRPELAARVPVGDVVASDAIDLLAALVDIAREEERFLEPAERAGSPEELLDEIALRAGPAALALASWLLSAPAALAAEGIAYVERLRATRPFVPLGALDRWKQRYRRERDVAGSDPMRGDALWRAACWESQARDVHASGFPEEADRLLDRARDVLRVAAAEVGRAA